MPDPSRLHHEAAHQVEPYPPGRMPPWWLPWLDYGVILASIGLVIFDMLRSK